MYPVLKLTFYEIIKKKIFIYSLMLYLLLYTLFFFIILNNNSILTNNYFFYFLYYLSSLIMVITSTDLIKKNIEDGTIEIYLTKPIGRKEFFVYKYFSVILINPLPTIIFFIGLLFFHFFLAGEINILFINIFSASLLIYIVFYTMFFFINLVTGNYNLSLLFFVTCVLINILHNLGENIIILNLSIKDNLLFHIAYIMVPKYVEISFLINNSFCNLSTLNHSLYFFIIFFGLSIITLHKKDY